MSVLRCSMNLPRMGEERMVRNLPIGHGNCLPRHASHFNIQNNLVLSFGCYTVTDLYELILLISAHDRLRVFSQILLS
jgi:hypothetical protein